MPWDAETFIVELSERLRALSDIEMRVAYVQSLLRAQSADEVAELMMAASSGAEERVPGRAEVFFVLTLVMARAEESLRTSVSDAAYARGFFNVVRRLYVPPEDAEDERGSGQLVARGRDGRPLSLGERKAIARQPNRALITKVIRDPSADVMRILLGNPGLTEDDVVRLCARRPAVPDVLREVFRSAKWMLRPHVRAVLVKNPFTPRDIALALVPLLGDTDLREAARSTELDDIVRDACAARLRSTESVKPTSLH